MEDKQKAQAIMTRDARQAIIEFKTRLKTDLDLNDTQINDFLQLASILAYGKTPLSSKVKSVLINSDGKSLTATGKRVWGAYQQI